jgi:hypothetical protein
LGNEAIIAIQDYTDDCEVDNMRKILVMYIESIKNMPEFLLRPFIQGPWLRISRF